jgi:hypothetical protein
MKSVIVPRVEGRQGFQPVVQSYQVGGRLA